MTLSRRHFFFGTLALPALAAKKPAGETPHVLLILAENLPAFVLGCYGNKEVQTPSIDRLAQTGTRFSNHFAAAPLPAPARAALLTGRPAPKAGGATLDQLMAAASYATQAAGNAAEAAKFIDAQTGTKPFCLTVTLSDFSPPYAAGARFADRYAAARFETFAQIPPAANIARDKEMFGANLLPNLRKAAAAATALDAGVGELLAALTRKKLLDNTLIVFTAPTGSLLGRHGLWGAGDASKPVNFYEEVIATPMIWSWPARIAPLGVRPELVSAIDLVPTMCDLTTAEFPTPALPGRSYLPLAQNKPLSKKQPWRSTAFIAYDDGRVARDDRYKLILRNGGQGPNELYDVRVDPRETVNQVDNPQFLSVKTQLTAELKKAGL